ncbi:hypothetical protein LIQ05_04045 [Blautia glucerasea]|nr:hypothetical protein [Blautia glucerasea]MCB5386180.1 hypothetical protein [Blautia glucerasea]MCB5420534.1 hypothetical protein [Blautia luti]
MDKYSGICKTVGRTIRLVIVPSSVSLYNSVNIIFTSEGSRGGTYWGGKS